MAALGALLPGVAVVDRLRITGESGTSLRLNQLTGMTIVDGSLSYVAGDVSFGNAPFVDAVSYTNAGSDPATETVLAGIDAASTASEPGTWALLATGLAGLGLVAPPSPRQRPTHATERRTP